MGKCENCIYFIKQLDDPNRTYDGTCHRYPPDWPKVNTYYMCGEFKSKDEWREK